MIGSYPRFIFAAATISVFAFGIAQMVFGMIHRGAPIGWIVENWLHAGRFASLWIVMLFVILIRPAPWLGSTFAFVVSIAEYVLFAVLPKVGSNDPFEWANAWYGLRPALQATLMCIPAFAYCWLGVRNEWTLVEFKDVKEWFARERLHGQ